MTDTPSKRPLIEGRFFLCNQKELSEVKIKMAYYYIAGLPYSAELYHHGIKGQKWGIRRFQNADGTLTNAGKSRYGSGSNFSGNSSGKDHTKLKRNLKTAAKVAVGVAGAAALGYGAYRLGKSGALSDFASRQAETGRRIRDATNAHKLSNAELTEKLARLETENKLRNETFNSIMNPADPNKRIILNAGKKALETVLAGAGVYGVKMALTNNFNAKDAADYLAPKPKKK